MIRKKLPLPAAGGHEGERDKIVLILSTPTPALPHRRGRGCLHNYGLIRKLSDWLYLEPEDEQASRHQIISWRPPWPVRLGSWR
jgi:hypothetical protein